MEKRVAVLEAATRGRVRRELRRDPTGLNSVAATGDLEKRTSGGVVEATAC